MQVRPGEGRTFLLLGVPVAVIRIDRGSPAVPGIVQHLGHGDVIVIGPDAPQRPDWGGFGPALFVAITRGAEILRGGPRGEQT